MTAVGISCRYQSMEAGRKGGLEELTQAFDCAEALSACRATKYGIVVDDVW